MAERIIVLTPLTIGQYREGMPFDGGVVKKVGPAEMIVDIPEPDQQNQRTPPRTQASQIHRGLSEVHDGDGVV